ncbi:MAG: hypothetical protein NVSMB25_18920 [Thermoleophilaceae bacterium]
MASLGAPAAAEPLPELAGVPWRPLVDAHSLRRRGRLWTLSAALHTIPFIAAAAVLVALNPVATPVSLAALAHAWIIPELYAFRGANVIRRRRCGATGPTPRRLGTRPPEAVAQGLLGDLLGHEERGLQRRSGLALERGALGVWLVGEAGALLVEPGGRRVHCFCVGVTDSGLPPSDRIAHLLLALRTDESGFATVANHAFAGAPWRLRRRLPIEARECLEAARAIAGAAPTG